MAQKTKRKKIDRANLGDLIIMLHFLFRYMSSVVQRKILFKYYNSLVMEWEERLSNKGDLIARQAGQL